jgi:hypothetical protein
VLAIILVGEVLLIQARRILDPGQSQPGLSAQSSGEVSEYDVGPTPEDIATPSTIWVSDEDLPVEKIEEPAEEILPEPDDASEVLEPPDPAPLPTPP